MKPEARLSWRKVCTRGAPLVCTIPVHSTAPLTNKRINQCNNRHAKYQSRAPRAPVSSPTVQRSHCYSHHVRLSRYTTGLLPVPDHYAVVATAFACGLRLPSTAVEILGPVLHTKSVHPLQPREHAASSVSSTCHPRACEAGATVALLFRTLLCRRGIVKGSRGLTRPGWGLTRPP